MSKTQNKSQRLLSAELRAGERLIWYDRPPALGRAFSYGLVLLFMLIWTGFAVSWTSLAFTGDGDGGSTGLFGMFPVFGLPLVMIGFITTSGILWTLGSVFFTHYGLTDRRVIILVDMWPGRVESYDEHWLSGVEHTVKGASGTITLYGQASSTGRDKIQLHNLSESGEVAAAIRKWLLKN